MSIPRGTTVPRLHGSCTSYIETREIEAGAQIKRMKRAPTRIKPKREDQRNSNEHVYKVHGQRFGVGV